MPPANEPIAANPAPMTGPAADDALDRDFAAAMAQLGPFGPAPRLAVALSGGADSTALLHLTKTWTRQNGGRLRALIVDHGLRAEAAGEALQTQQSAAAHEIEADILTLRCHAGAALQENARIARHAALAEAARATGCLHLLLGHHAGDQSETVAMRAERGPGGREGMAAWTARNDVILLRPLLGIAPGRLRDYLRRRAIAWIDDPSNINPRFERVRHRLAGSGQAADALPRQARDAEVAAFLAQHASIRPEGFALLHTDIAPPSALAVLLRTIAGATYAPAQDAVAALAANLRPATLGGVRVVAAGKLGPGWLLARESAACQTPVPAQGGVIWDGRFRLLKSALGSSFAALGADAPAFRKSCALPALVLQTMPCLRDGKGEIIFPAPVRFNPPAPAAAHPFQI